MSKSNNNKPQTSGPGVFTFPAEWDDEEKMNVMFAPFRDKTTYPKAWEQKMKFWTNLIMNLCRHEDQLVIDVKLLPQKFRRKGRLPVCLEPVLQELIRQKKIQKLSDFEAQKSGGWLSWGFNTFVKSPVTWSVGMMWRRQASPVEGLYVVTDLIDQEKSAAVLNRHYSTSSVGTSEDVVEYNTLREQCRDICPDLAAFTFLLQKLAQQGKISVFETEEEPKVKLIKIAKKGEPKVSAVTSNDISIYKIKKTSELLEKQIEELQEDMNRYQEDARDYIRRGLKTTALHALKKKRKTQALVDKKLNSLDALHSMQEKLANTASNKMVLDAYEAGSSALKNYMKTNNLTLDKVDDILDNIQEVSQEQDEINDSIASFSMYQGELTETDLEAELDKILSPQKEEDMEVEEPAEPREFGDFQLPDVPQFSPSRPPATFKSPRRTPQKRARYELDAL